MEEIDFILPWVDDSDAAWHASKRQYAAKDSGASAADANSSCRFRDNGLLRYWFRGIEKYSPWVRRVHFVTCGHYPAWLNINHPKLHLVNHSDYIPKEYLPTFNSNTIELNYHRIKELSERFVLFNDDMLLTRDVTPGDYFFKGDPILESSLRYTGKVGYNNWSRFVFNDYCIVNNSFDIRKSIWDNRRKWFNIRELGVKQARKNLLCYLANQTLPVGLYGHIALPHLKSSLQELWDRYPDVMDNSCRHRFRSDDQVNQWLLCAWNQAKGRFYPTRPFKQGRLISITPNTIGWIDNAIRSQGYPLLCLNENERSSDLENSMRIIRAAFNFILPGKSSFEMD